MTRRRTFGLIFGLLIAVYLIAATVTVVVVRDRLQDAVDRDLDTALDGVAAFLDSVDATEIDNTFEIDVNENERALIIIEGRNEITFVPAGPRGDPLPRPEVTASMIVNRVGSPFQVNATTGNVDYRVLSSQLDDGRYLALAQPLDNLQDVLNALRWLLLVTLFAVVAVLGAVFWMILRASLRPYEDMIDTAEAIARGDLDRRAAATAHQPEIEQLAGSLNTMLDRIQDSFQAKESAEARLKQFLADASHELRTPLTSIRGYSELYLSGAATDPESITKQMTRINAEAARMGRLVGDLLTLARFDQTRHAVLVPVELSAIVNDAVDDARAASPSHEVITTIAARPAIVYGEADAIRQVVANLITNARTHTPAGTVITVTLETTDTLITLAVADNGPGISPDRSDHIFDRFYRADNPVRSDGSGLGLAIVAAIVTAHAGTIQHSANHPSGAVFTLQFPRRTEEPTAAETLSSSEIGLREV